MTNWEQFKYRWSDALSFREPPTLPAHGWSYFDHMVAVYLTLNVEDERATAVIEKARSRPFGLTWSDIFLLENVVLELQQEEDVRRKAWIVRERFREVAGPAVYNQYVQSGIPNAADCPLPKLRADMSRILDFLHWYYALIPIRERMRKRLTSSCILIIGIYMVVLVVALFLLKKHDHPFLAMSVCVIFWGLIGGFVSSQRRMQKIPPEGDPLIGVFGLENAGYYLWLSPLLGSIFAAVLTLLFMGGILQGIVFPTFTAACDSSGHSMFNPACISLPACALDYAKLFVWCFMAGFAEKLVPDSLDRLTSKLDSNQQTRAQAPPVQPTPVPGGVNKNVPGKGQQVDKSTLHDALATGEPQSIEDPDRTEAGPEHMDETGAH